MARPRKPTRLKLVTATYQKSRANLKEPKVEPNIPQPPYWLKSYLRPQWFEIAGRLYKLGIITNLDAPALIGYVLSEELVQVLDEQWRKLWTVDGPLLTSQTETGSKKHPLITMRQEALKDMARYADALGMTPSGRSRIEANPPLPEDGPEAEFFGRQSKFLDR